MSTTPSVDRKIAASLNPFIGSSCTEDSLDAIKLTLIEIGCLLTSADSQPPARLWWVLDAMACALAYESENIHSARQAGKEANHV